MVVTDVYQQVTLNARDETFLQNTNDLTIFFKISELIPTDDENKIVVAPVTRGGDGSLLYKNELGNLWVKVSTICEYNEAKTYSITVI